MSTAFRLVLAGGLAFAGFGCRQIFQIDHKVLIIEDDGGGGAAGSGGAPLCEPGLATCDPTRPCQTDLASDAEHCGRCQRSCAGGACVSGRCPVLSHGPAGAFTYDITHDEDFIYWTSGEPSAVLRIAKAGGVVELVYGRSGHPVGVRLHAGYVYWTMLFDGEIWRAGLDGHDPELLAGGLAKPDHLEHDGTDFYVSRHAPKPQGGITRLPLNGGPAVSIVSNQPAPNGIAVDATHVYWANKEEPGVWRVHKDGSNLEPVFVSPRVARAVAVDRDMVVVQDVAEGRLLRIDKESGAIEVLADESAEVGHIVIHDGRVYWSSFERGAIGVVDADGANPLDLARGQAAIEDGSVRSSVPLTVDAERVYWVAGREVRSTPK